MKAILWKKYLNIKKSKSKLLMFFLTPIIYLTLIVTKGISINTTIAYFPFLCTLIINLCNWSLEDLIYTESILTSRISIKSVWKVNYLFISITGYCYSLIILLIAILLTPLSNSINNISVITLLMSCFLVIVDITILANSTLHYSDFSKLKQCYSSIYGIATVVLPIMFLFKTHYFKISLLYFLGSIVVSLLLLFIAKIVVNRVNNESLLLNMQKLVTGYNNNIILE